MIREFRLGIKLIRYTFGIKMCVGFGALFLVLGIIMSILEVSFSQYGIVNGGFFLMTTGLWVTQLFLSLAAANMVQTSTWKKAAQTTMPAMLSLLGFTVGYAILILIKLPFLSGADAEGQQRISATLVVNASLALIIMIYCGTAYKLYISSTIAFFAVFIVIDFTFGMFVLPIVRDLSFGAAAGIGFLIIAAGAFLQYGLSVLVYKLPLSKRAQLRSLQKYM